MRGLLIGALALACGCAGARPELGVRGYRRVGVLPFTDGLGRGPELSEAAARALRARALDPISTGQIETVFRELGIAPGEPVGGHDLARLGALLKADALLVASFDCRPGARAGRATALLLEPGGGEALARARFEVPGCAAADGPERFSRGLAAALR